MTAEADCDCVKEFQCQAQSFMKSMPEKLANASVYIGKHHICTVVWCQLLWALIALCCQRVSLSFLNFFHRCKINGDKTSFSRLVLMMSMNLSTCCSFKLRGCFHVLQTLTLWKVISGHRALGTARGM